MTRSTRFVGWLCALSLFVAAVACWAGTAQAATLTWDADTVNAGAQDGTGTWDTALNNWWDPIAGANVLWNSSGATDSAVIGAGGTGNNISVSGSISADDISINPVAGNYILSLAGSTTLAANTLSRVSNPIVQFSGPNLGVNAPGTVGSSNVTFVTTPASLVGGAGALGTTTMSIIPWAIGQDTIGTVLGLRLVGYTAANGVHPLRNNEFVTTLYGGDTTNVGLGAPINPAGNVSLPLTFRTTSSTINALEFASNSTNNSLGPYIQGGGTLTITSGTILYTEAATGGSGFTNAGMGTTLPGGVAFGSAEAVITATYRTFWIGDTVTGTGGLTKSGNGDLYMAGAIQITGPITQNAGNLYMNAALDNASAVAIRSGRLIFMNAGNVAYSGAISGGGALGKLGAGTMTLSGANTYTGATTAARGTLRLDYSTADNSKLADGAALILAGGTVELAGIGGTHTEVVVSTTLNNGDNRVTRSSGAAVLSMGAINRSGAATLNFGAENIATTTTGNNTAGIIGGWATVGGVDWAVGGGSVTALPALSYTTLTTAGGGMQTTDNFSLSGGLTMTGSVTSNSLKIANSADDDVLDLGANNATFNGASGGLLYVGGSNNKYTITGTGVIGGGATGEFIVNTKTGTELTISAPIISAAADAGSLTKTGGGTLNVNGTNTFTGPITIDDGKLVLANPFSNTVTFGGEGTLQVKDNSTTGTGSLQLNAIGTVDVDEGKVFTVTAFSSGGPGAGLTTGLIKKGKGTIAFATVATDNVAGMGAGAGNTSLFTAYRIDEGTFSIANAATNQKPIKGVTNDPMFVTLNGGNFSWDGEFCGNNVGNDYHGLFNIEVSAASATITNNRSNLTNQAALIRYVKHLKVDVNSTLTFDIGPGVTSGAAGVNFADGYQTAGGRRYLTALLGDTTFNVLNKLDLSGNVIVTNTVTLGRVSDDGAPRTITKTGDGTLAFPQVAASMVDGTKLNIVAGTVNANNATGLGTLAAVDVADGAVFNIGASQTIGSLSNAGSSLNNGAVTIGPGLTLTVGSTNNLSSAFSGVIAGATGALTKGGTGELTLSNAANTYGGATTVNAGTLKLKTAGNTNIANSPRITVGNSAILDVTEVGSGVGGFQVLTGQTLGGNGTVNGAVTVNTGGTLAPGASAGTLNAGASISMAADSIYNWELDGASADKVDITGSLTLTAGWNLALTRISGTPEIGSRYELFTYTTTFSGSAQADIGATPVEWGWPTAVTVHDSKGKKIYVQFGFLGDTNFDGVVDAADYITVKQNFGMTGATLGPEQGDFDYNGTVDWDDLQTMMANFGTRSVGGAPSAPEPGSVMLLMFGALALLRRRKA